MQHEIRVGTVSWIEGKPNPMWTAIQAAALSPDWVPKTYLGLAATSNPTPPDTLPDFLAYQADKNFRALTYCRFRVDVDERARQVTGFEVLDAVHDGGWTPPFRMRNWPLTLIAFDRSIYDRTWYQGESSPLSLVKTRNGHANTTISSVPADETVLVNALIKFRAGQHTDDIGIKRVGSPFHVPWVWCEMVLTYSNGEFKMFGRGSIFPSHAWYFNGSRMQLQAEIGDETFPLARTTINVKALRLYPVLSRGALAPGLQTPLSEESGRAGSLESHPNTVSGGKVWSKTIPRGGR